MTQHASRDAILASTASAHGAIAADSAASIPDDEPSSDDWNEQPPPWRRPHGAEVLEPEQLEELSFGQITNRHMGKLNELIEQTHPLAKDYLSGAAKLPLDTPGRDRKINLGCKLALATGQLINTVQRLSENAEEGK